MRLPAFIMLKKIFDRLSSKGYVGIMSANLPSSPKAWGRSDMLTAADISVYVARALDKRAETVARIEWTLGDDRGDDSRSPLLEVLYRPNPFFTKDQFWNVVQRHYDTIGEAYVYIERDRQLFEGSKVKSLHILDPRLMKPVITAEGIVGYEASGSSPRRFDLQEILYLRRPDAVSPLRGVSLLKPGITTIQTEAQINEYHARVLKNGGKPEGVFSFKVPNLTRDQLREIKDKYRSEYSEAKRAGLPLFLGGDSTYTRTGLTPDELSYLEAKKMTVEDICVLTQVPRSMLASTNDAKFDNADADRVIFLSETIDPLQAALTTALNEQVFPQGVELRHVSQVPEDVDRKLKETESGVKSGWMTINEARERYGYEPVDGGDSPLVPFTVMPLGSEPAQTAEPEEAEEKSVKQEAHPLDSKGARDAYFEIQSKRLDRRSGVFKKSLDAYLEGQRDRVLHQLDPKVSRTFRQKDFIDESFILEAEIRKGKEQLLPIMEELMLQAGIDATELAGSGNFVLSADIRSWLDSKSSVFLRQINETTFSQLKAQFEQSLSEGESRRELINRIEDTYGNITKKRAATIARTEVHAVSQKGTIEGYRAAGLKNKVWVSVRGATTRPEHAAADGQKVPIDMPFDVGGEALMFPGDPSGSPANTINCQCQT